jgi:glycosyltransferase involved in cell wall biosynthesis
VRITHYHPRALVGDGGPTLSMRQWARGMAAAGHDVAVIYDEYEPERQDGSVEWIHVPHRRWRGMRVPTGIDYLLGETDLFVLQSGWVAHNVMAARHARRLRIPYVVTPHGAYHPKIVSGRRWARRPWWLALERPLLRDSLAVHVFFEGEKANLEAIGYRGPFVVAPNGVAACDALRAPSEATWDGGSGGYVVWLGRYDPTTKGLDLLLAALSTMPEGDRPLVRLHGPDYRDGKAAVRAMVKALGLTESVLVGDAVYGEDKMDLLRRAQMFAYPARWDSSSMAVMEAAAMGLPILASRTSYIGPELAEHRAASVVDLQPDALAAGLRLAGSPEARAMGARARELAAERFSWQAVVGRWLAQVEALM